MTESLHDTTAFHTPYKARLGKVGGVGGGKPFAR